MLSRIFFLTFEFTYPHFIAKILTSLFFPNKNAEMSLETYFQGWDAAIIGSKHNIDAGGSKIPVALLCMIFIRIQKNVIFGE
jgi:hypothetical protein